MYRLLRAFLFLFSAETAHHVALTAWGIMLRLPVVGRLLSRLLLGPLPSAAKGCTVAGIRFPSAIGLAAGFDKNGRYLRQVHAFGFGFVEVGTVTAKAQPGNPTPRLFRLPADEALINRLGFNNAGALAVLQAWRKPPGLVVGINIGKSKVCPLADAAADYRYSTKLLAPLADYLVINISSPNTPGLRQLQAVDKLRPIVEAVQDEMAQGQATVPLFLKVAPDLADADLLALADFAVQAGVTGLVACNTTISRDGLSSPREAVEQIGAGGLSGRPVQGRALEVLRLLKGHTGERLVLISVGGIDSAAQARARLAAGASLVQLYTAFIYQGPRLVGDIRRAIDG